LPLHKIVVSKWLDEIMRTQYGDRSADIVPNGVDRALFHSEPRGKQARPTVGMLYNPTPLKGIEIALSALQLVQATTPDLRVLMFGLEAP
jgi:glycosyltransferase involved in cell wall biosynthesis